MYVDWITRAETAAGEVRLFPHSNTCSLLSGGTWKEERYFIACFHLFPKERFLFASPDYKYVWMPAKINKECLRGHITWKKRLPRVIGVEGSPKLEHAYNIFSLLPPPPFSKMKTSPQTLPKHPKQPWVPSLPPSIHTHSLWKSSTSAWMTLDQAILVSPLPNLYTYRSEL